MSYLDDPNSPLLTVECWRFLHNSTAFTDLATGQGDQKGLTNISHEVIYEEVEATWLRRSRTYHLWYSGLATNSIFSSFLFVKNQ